jgi:hypothetical protein
MLKFSFGNSKLIHGEIIFDLVAGYSCPFANTCLSRADRQTGKITDGPNTKHRCYHASSETRPTVRAAHWHNFDLVKKAKTRKNIFKLINDCLPYGLVYRIHSGGDFFSQDYFDAWLDVARAHPERIFYAYTKALPFWVKRLDVIPKNVKLTASYGGTRDDLISLHKLKFCRIVLYEWEAKELGLEIDHDDSHCWKTDYSFAVLIHGTQPKGSEAGKAWYAQNRKTGYGQHKEKLWNGQSL